MNKKAQEEFLSGWNVLVWIVLVAIMLIAVAIYNNKTTDSRTLEAKILNEKIIDCIVQDDGSLIENFSENFSIYDSCLINPELFEEERVLFAEIELLEIENQQTTIRLIFGNTDLAFRCELENDEKFANCFNEIIFVNDELTGKTLQMNVKTGSNNNGRKTA